jgi:hypothetical protein
MEEEYMGVLPYHGSELADDETKKNGDSFLTAALLFSRRLRLLDE